jgi:NAD(P)H-nitrite reductase large subunit
VKNSDEQICKCFGLFSNDLHDLIEIHQYNNVAGISEDFGYGTKCGKCVPLIEAIIDRSKHKGKLLPGDT